MSDNDTQAATKGTHNSREWTVSGPDEPSRCYPKAESYTWGEFAGLAIEMGGYSDISLVDPYSGRRFWLGQAFTCDAHARALQEAEPGEAAIAVYAQKRECLDCGVSFYGALRRAIDAAEAAGFPDRFRRDETGESANPHEDGGVHDCESCTEIRGATA